ncbi:MAG: CapA family protein [Coriobacteriia bacterium]|nr:CapA family protein [Coriobacteriia bacterium]
MTFDRESARSDRRERQRAAARARATRAMAIGGTTALVLVLLAGGGLAVASVLRDRAPAPTPVTAYPVGLETSAPVSAARRAADWVRAESEPETITIAAVGDLLFDLGPRRLIDAQGGAAPLAKVASILKAADVTIANLETTLSNRGESVKGKPANLIFNGHPRGIESLTTAGIDLVSLANNHAMDHGTPALEDTLAALDEAGVKHAGAGLSTKAAWEPAIIEVKGRRIAYVTATQIVPSYFEPGPDRAGIANGKNVEKVVTAIRAARKRADIVIVSLHWGKEQAYAANASQVSQSKRFIDAGADIVLSHHPHVMQGIDTYKGKLIAYSLGNFLFPYKTTEGRKSFILRFDYGPAGVGNITAVPVYLGEWGRPVPQTGTSARSILGKLDSISRPFGTRVVIEGDVGRILP